jgi:Fic family protein
MGLNWRPSSPPPFPGDRLTHVPRPQPAKAGLTSVDENFEQVAQRVRSEYLEMPGLNLTKDQARCLWGIDAPTCDRLLAHLVETGFLVRTSHATYVRLGG